MSETLSVLAIVLSLVSMWLSWQTVQHGRAAKWNLEQASLWRTDPAQARRRKADPPGFERWSRKHRGGTP